MKEATEAAKGVLDKVSQFLDLFDLSFVLSGAVATSAILFWCQRNHVPVPIPFDGWHYAVILLGVFYIVGFVTFAVGRFLRTILPGATNRFDEHFEKILKGHGLQSTPPFSDYLGRSDSRGVWRLYVRLWAELRLSSEANTSLGLLNRYWVMAATSDGLCVAALLWLAIVGLQTFGPTPDLSRLGGGVLMAICLGCALVCGREADRYQRYQAEELVAAVTALRSRKP